MGHDLRKRPEGRFQCTACRAAFQTMESARLSAVPCAGEPLAHGLTREHLVYPRSDADHSCAAWSCDEPDPTHYHGPDPYCDELTCRICCHGCDCDVCKGLVTAPGLARVEDLPYYVIEEKERKKKMAADLKTMLAGLKVGEYVAATGVDTRGHAVTRVGFLLWEPKEVKAQRNGTSTKAWRVFVGEKGQDATERQTWVTMFPDNGAVEVITRDEAGLVWKDTELGDAVSSSVIVYGGKGGQYTHPRMAVKVRIRWTDQGNVYHLLDLETDESVATFKRQSRIWWAPMPDDHYEQYGTLPRQQRAQVEGEWQKRKMGDFVNWGDEPRYFRYGGLAKRKPLAEGRMVRVRWAESRHGANKLVDVHTNEIVDVVHSASNIWAVPATAEELASMPPLVELPDARPEPEQREEPEWDDAPAPVRRKPIRSGVLFEGWVGELDPQHGFKVWDNARRRLIGWLSPDHHMFRPVGV